jgi:hypothetical protein
MGSVWRIVPALQHLNDVGVISLVFVKSKDQDGNMIGKAVLRKLTSPTDVILNEAEASIIPANTEHFEIMYALPWKTLWGHYPISSMWAKLRRI